MAKTGAKVVVKKAKHPIMLHATSSQKAEHMRQKSCRNAQRVTHFALIVIIIIIIIVIIIIIMTYIALFLQGIQQRFTIFKIK